MDLLPHRSRSWRGLSRHYTALFKLPSALPGHLFVVSRLLSLPVPKARDSLDLGCRELFTIRLQAAPLPGSAAAAATSYI
jgi:hypothetical protein